MITNVIYLNNIAEIANLFCNNELCKTNIKERLKNNFDNESMGLFLSLINSGRTYLGKFKNYRTGGSPTRRYIDLYLTDVITGENIKLTWNWLLGGDFFKQLQEALSFHNYDMIKGNNIFTQENFEDVRVYNNPLKSNYGLTYIPGSVPGGQGGGSIITTPPVTTPAPGAPGSPVAQSGGLEDLFSLLSNPLIIAGLAVGGYLIWKGSK